jgi:penicillin amidase
MFNKNKFSFSGPKSNDIKISRDQEGVPHIIADDMNGAIWGSGYAHAVDRGTQLMMMRILGQGRVCELLSDNEDSLKIDRFFRRANWHRNLDKEVAKLDEKSALLCQAYCDGINAGVASKNIYALKLMGYQPEPWTIQDSILVSRMAGYLTLSQSQAEVERFFIELVQLGVSTEKLSELFPIDAVSLDRALIESIELQERIVPTEVIWNQALPRMMASNNWVVSGDKTSSGKPIMANDPHLEVNRLPNVWCEQSLKWPGHSIVGMGMPGLPGLVIGRTKHLAWGATYTFMDTVDSWVEDCKAGKYRKGESGVGETWHKFTERKERIKRKKHADDTITFYENHHGVLEGDPNKVGRYLATKWVAADSGASSLMSCFKIAEAKTAEQAMDILGGIESAWNWVISDVDDNIAYQMSGLMPKRHPEWNGFTPAPGWDDAYDWKGVVDYKDLPNCLNPEVGYIVTANQDLNYLGKLDPINMPMGNYRAKRIEDVLENSNQHDVESTKSLQFDVYSNQAKLFLDILLPILQDNGESSDAFELLKTWDCCYGFDSKGAPIFEVFYEALRLEIFGSSGAAEEGLSESVINHLSEQTGLFIDFYQNFDSVILNKKSVWYEKITQKQAFIAAFEIAKAARSDVSWKEVNTITFTNMLFQGKLPAFMGFDSKPIALLGGRATPHQGQIYSSAGRKTSFSPSVRLIADMSESVLHTCLAGGPSDNRFSCWYKSGLKKWVEGDYKILKG